MNVKYSREAIFLVMLETVTGRWYPSAAFHTSQVDVGESENIQKQFTSTIRVWKTCLTVRDLKSSIYLAYPGVD